MPEDCAMSDHCVSVLVRAWGNQLSLYLPPSHLLQGAGTVGWGGREASCSHPTPLAFDGEGALLVQRE